MKIKVFEEETFTCNRRTELLLKWIFSLKYSKEEAKTKKSGKLEFKTETIP